MYKTLKKTLKITVTQEDIDDGKVSNPYQCPIARAVRRTKPEWHGITIYPDTLIFYDYTNEYRTRLPKEVWQFLRRFDSGDTVEPFTFQTIEVQSA